MAGFHARNAPSSAAVWMRCPGSVALCQGIPDEATVWAAEGTCAHAIREECLRTGREPTDFLGTLMMADGYKFKFSKEWVWHLQPGIDRVRDLGGKLYVETRVFYHHWGTKKSDQFGRLDVGIIKKNLIVIDDLKFGAGVPVDPEDNEQLMIYALGFWENVARHLTEAKEFLINIDQPRAQGGGGEWRVSLRKLLRFGERLKKAVEATYASDAPLIPGVKQCRFCPAAELNICPAYANFHMELAGITKKDLSEAYRLDIEPRPTPKKSLTPKQMSVVALHAPMFRKWLDQVHNEVLANAISGDETPGVKAVVGRKGPRHYTDKERVQKRLERLLGDDAFNKELKSPTQVEPLLSVEDWKGLQKFIDQSDGRPSLVPVSDKRKAIEPEVLDFDAFG